MLGDSRADGGIYTSPEIEVLGDTEAWSCAVWAGMSSMSRRIAESKGAQGCGDNINELQSTKARDEDSCLVHSYATLLTKSKPNTSDTNLNVHTNHEN